MTDESLRREVIAREAALDRLLESYQDRITSLEEVGCDADEASRGQIGTPRGRFLQVDTAH